MSFQEIRSLTTSLTTVFIVIFYYIFLINHYNIEFNAQNVDFSFWGTAILLMVPVLVVAQIIVQIIIHIIMAILTKGKEDLALEDERDKLIDLKSTRNFYHVFMAGFFIGIGTLAFGFSPLVMFNVFLATILLSAIVGGASQFLYYRRGV